MFGAVEVSLGQPAEEARCAAAAHSRAPTPAVEGACCGGGASISALFTAMRSCVRMGQKSEGMSWVW